MVIDLYRFKSRLYATACSVSNVYIIAKFGKLEFEWISKKKLSFPRKINIKYKVKIL